MQHKKHELSNHLGNVLATITDRKVPDIDISTSTYNYYNPQITSITDYYPFGMQIEERSWVASSSYRFGFNGQEKENDISGEGNHLIFSYRIHDARLGRFLSVDPLFGEYSWNSTYAFAENDVIRAIDLEGAEKFIATEKALDDGLVRVVLTLVSDESIKQQSEAGIPLVSFDNGVTFTANFKYNAIHKLLSVSYFENGVLFSTINDKKTMISGHNPTNVSGYKAASEHGKQFGEGTPPPMYFISPVVKVSESTKVVTDVVHADFDGFEFGEATTAQDAVIYSSANANGKAIFTYWFGSASFPNQIWDITISDKVTGEILHKLTNVNTGGAVITEDLSSILKVGAHTIKVSVAPSAGSKVPTGGTGAATSTDYTFDLAITTEQIETTD